MSRFTVRVELFGNADEDNYESLHKRMQAKKYFRVIKSSDGDWNHLPSATYNHTADVSASTVQADVWAIAKAVWDDPGVLVTESADRSWRGLRKATSSEVRELTS